MSDKLIQSYVWHDGKCFFVSTIDRESSSALAYGGMYAETMAWDYNYKESKRGDIVGQAESSQGSIHGHMKMCKLIHETGKAQEIEK